MSTQFRRLIEEAPPEEQRLAANRFFDVLMGNEPGRVTIYDDDGLVRDIQGGATISSNNFAGEFRSGIGNHLRIPNAAGSGTLMTISEAGGARVMADMSHATIANRLLFVASGTNQPAAVGVIPSGTGTQGDWVSYNNATPASATGAAVLRAMATAVQIRADSPAASYLPLEFATNNTVQARISTTGAFSLLGSGGFTITAGGLTITAGNLTMTAGNVITAAAAGFLHGATPATTGAYRLSSGDAFVWRNAANSADLAAIQVAADDFLYLGLGTANNPTVVVRAPTSVIVRIGSDDVITADTSGVTIGVAGSELGFFGGGGATLQTVEAEATDPASTMDLANSLRDIVLAYGLAEE